MRKMMSVLALILVACGGGEDAAVDETKPHGAGSAGVAGSVTAAGASGIGGTAAAGSAGLSGSAGIGGAGGKPGAPELHMLPVDQDPASTVLLGSSFVPAIWVRLGASFPESAPGTFARIQVTSLRFRLIGPFDCEDVLEAVLLEIPTWDWKDAPAVPSDARPSSFRTARIAPATAPDGQCALTFAPWTLRFDHFGGAAGGGWVDVSVAFSLSPASSASGGTFRVAIDVEDIQTKDPVARVGLKGAMGTDRHIGTETSRIAVVAETVAEDPIPAGPEPRTLMGWRMVGSTNDMEVHGAHVALDGLVADAEYFEDIFAAQLWLQDQWIGKSLVAFDPMVFLSFWDTPVPMPIILSGQKPLLTVRAPLVKSGPVLKPRIAYPADIRMVDLKFGVSPLVCLSEAQPGCEGSGANAVFPPVTVVP